MTVLILGASGMLGHDVLQEFVKKGIPAIGTVRASTEKNGLVQFDARTDSIEELLDNFPDIRWVINAIGIIKPHIKDADSESVTQAIEVNALFPHKLASAAASRDIKILQIATDCVFSGIRGASDENTDHDPLDVYGKTKSLGEVWRSNVMNIRSSIIGREVGRSTSLVEWVLEQAIGASINGYTNHHWNGVTTAAFAKVCAGVIDSGDFLPGVVHLVPKDMVTKFELVKTISQVYERTDIEVQPFAPVEGVDRTLSTTKSVINEQMWSNAGYQNIPTIEEMIIEYRAFNQS